MLVMSLQPRVCLHAPTWNSVPKEDTQHMEYAGLGESPPPTAQC